MKYTITKENPKTDWIVSWSMPNGTKRSKGGGINCWEPVLVYGKNPFMLDHKQFRSLASNEDKHPTAKPLGAWRWLINNASSQNGLILDPFLGSGTTAVAAKKLNRHYIGIEISEKYCEIAARRLSQDVMVLDIPEPPPKKYVSPFGPEIEPLLSRWVFSDGTEFTLNDGQK